MSPQISKKIPTKSVLLFWSHTLTVHRHSRCLVLSPAIGDPIMEPLIYLILSGYIYISFFPLYPHIQRKFRGRNFRVTDF